MCAIKLAILFDGNFGSVKIFNVIHKEKKKKTKLSKNESNIDLLTYKLDSLQLYLCDELLFRTRFI